MPDLDAEELRLDFKTFGQEDMLNPTFKVGQVLRTVQLLRKDSKQYTCENNVSLSMPTNDHKRFATR